MRSRGRVNRDLFARVPPDDRWRLRLEPFQHRGATPGELAEIVAEGRDVMRAAGLAAPPAADVVAAAAAAGAAAVAPLFEILDGGDFERAPCLCCFVARSTERARAAGMALAALLRYFDPGSYLRSRAFLRDVATLSRDATASELREVAADLSTLDATSDTVRRINAGMPGRVCVATPACRPDTVWVYSTPEARRALRGLSRQVKRGGLTVRVSVASADAAVAPRHRYRMYAVRVAAAASPGDTGVATADAAAGAVAKVLAALADWVRSGGDPGAKATDEVVAN